MLNQAEILAIGLFGGVQAQLGGQTAGFGFGLVTQGKIAGGQQFLGEIVEKVGLVFGRIHGAAKLVAPGARILGNAGVVTGGDAIAPQFGFGVLQHRPKFHRSVALGTGQRGHAAAVARDQIIDDLPLKHLAAIDNVVGNAQILAELSGIHHALGAALTLALHQPQSNAHHVVALLVQGGRRHRTVYAARETDYNPFHG